MKNKILLLFCFFQAQYFCQTLLGVDTLLKSGPIDKRINLVILSDGYMSSEMTQFIANANTFSNYLLSTSPFINYKKYFNVFAIKVASPQSGVTHPGTATDVVEPQSPILNVTNNFDTRFDNYGVHRSICSMDPGAVYAVLASEFPAYDQILVLGNSTEYGGTGGPIAVSSIHNSAPEIVAHEMGHSFAGLADEYWAGIGFATEKPNMTSTTHTSSVKWAPWLGINATGIFPYDTASPANAWFRPHQNCKMQFLNVPFCSVCKEAIIEKIHSFVNPIDEYFPDNNWSYLPVGSVQLFKANFVKPLPNTLKQTWELNFDVFERNKDSISIPNEALQDGDNSLILTVCDTTTLSKDTGHVNLHTYSVAWSISYSTLGIKEIKAKMELSVFPNPAFDVINLKYHLFESSNVRISLLDLNGKVLVEEILGKLESGDYERKFDVRKMKEGSYILALRINTQVINNKIIITK